MEGKEQARKARQLMKEGTVREAEELYGKMSP